MSDHATTEDLEAFFREELPTERAQVLLRHFLDGCERCSEASILLILQVLDPEQRDVSSEEDYDAAISRAAGAAFRHHSLVQPVVARLAQPDRESLADDPNVNRLTLYEALLQCSWKLRYDDPQQMVKAARSAAFIADTLDPEIYGTREVVDLQCRAWIESSNAHRLADDLAQASLDSAHAFQLFLKGTGDELLEAQYHDRAATLFADLRQFQSALSSLDIVYSIYRRRKDEHLAGRALVSKGIYTGYQGNPNKAVDLIKQGISMLDAQRDPNLLWVANQSQIWFLIEAGRYHEGRRLLLSGWSCCQNPGKSNLVRLRWAEGRLNAGLDRLDCAERDLFATKEGFEELGGGYDSALASLDLATVLLRRGKSAEAKSVGLSAAETFFSLKIESELQRAVFVIQRAFELEVATVALVEEVTKFLRRAENDPTARFELAD